MKQGIELNSLGHLVISAKLKKERRLYLESLGGFYRRYEDLPKSTKDFQDFLKFFILRAYKTIGWIIASEKISEEDLGYRIQFEYLDMDGVQIICDYSSTIHWPSEDVWQMYTKQREVGRNVIVFYDPDATSVCQLFFLDSWGGMEHGTANRKVLSPKEKKMVAKNSDY